jgi:orotidine-5'-phosphate decarboxylase
MILLDNKFSDIARIVLLQAERWSSYIPIDFVTAHACSGRKTIEILAKKYGVFIVAEMSSAANDYVYIRQAVELALDYNCGLVAQRRLDNKLPHLVPGVSLDRRTDLLGQNYKSPSEIDFADIVVVGEGIYNAENIEKSAQKYQMLLCAKIKTKL